MAGLMLAGLFATAATRGPLRASAAEVESLAAALGLQLASPGATVPPFLLQDLEGRPVSAEGLRGKVVLLSFFATWCPSCQAELPGMRGLAQRFRGTDFVLLLVTYGEALEAVRPLAGDLGFAHGVLLDPETRVGDTFGVRFLPTHFLIGRGGEMVATGVGPKAWDGPEAARLIGSLLADGG